MTRKDSFPDLATLKVDNLSMCRWVIWEVNGKWRCVNHKLGLCGTGWPTFEDATLAYLPPHDSCPSPGALPLLRERYLLYFGDKK